MNILIFSTAYLPFVGGAELAIKEIADRLPEVSFALITARFRRDVPKFERIGNVNVHRVGFGVSFDKWLLPWLGLQKAKELERKEGFDIIWSMMASQASIAAARFKKAFPEKRLVLTLQEGDDEAHLKRYAFGSEFLYRLLVRPWHLMVFRRADAVTAISNYLAERARKNNPNVPLTVIPNGVDVKNFQPTTNNQQREETRRRLGMGPADKVVITTSRLVKKNGVGDLIEAMRYVPEEVKLLVCGTGPLSKNLQLTTNNLQLGNRIRFLGHIPHENLPAYLHASDIFCRPSLSEGMGSSFIEAMAAELPVVATQVGGIPDFLRDKETGLLCEVNSPKSIAEKVKLLLSNDDLRKRIIKNASRMVREKYEWDGISEKMRKVFSQAFDS